MLLLPLPIPFGTPGAERDQEDEDADGMVGRVAFILRAERKGNGMRLRVREGDWRFR